MRGWNAVALVVFALGCAPSSKDGGTSDSDDTDSGSGDTAGGGGDSDTGSGDTGGGDSDSDGGGDSDAVAFGDCTLAAAGDHVVVLDVDTTGLLSTNTPISGNEYFWSLAAVVTGGLDDDPADGETVSVLVRFDPAVVFDATNGTQTSASINVRSEMVEPDPTALAPTAAVQTATHTGASGAADAVGGIRMRADLSVSDSATIDCVRFDLDDVDVGFDLHEVEFYSRATANSWTVEGT